MVNSLYYEHENVNDCKQRCDNYLVGDVKCNGINYVTSNQRCYLFSKATEIITARSNSKSSYRPCTNPTQCANWCELKGINGWCKACADYDVCKDCTECAADDKCTIRSTLCKSWCHSHTGTHVCSYTNCEGCDFCPQICPVWCYNGDSPKCKAAACVNCEQCRES